MKPVTTFRERGRWCATDGDSTWGPAETLGELIDLLDIEITKRHGELTVQLWCRLP